MGWFFPSQTMQLPGGQERYAVVVVAAAHAAALIALATVAPPERLIEAIRPFVARVVELRPEKPPEIPKPLPKKSPQPLPVLVSTAPDVAAPVFVVPQQPPLPPAPIAISAPPASAELPVVAARFDADYLDNPKPVYPHASRRLGEQGRVLLRVFVGSHGNAEKVEIKTSCGFERLDAAAREAVARWRFVPARRGDQAIAAWVQVPITFQLES